MTSSGIAACATFLVLTSDVICDLLNLWDSNMEPLNWTHPLIVKLIDNFYSFNLTPFLPFFKKERKLSCSWGVAGLIFCPFSLCMADKDKFSYGWTYARGHRSDVLMHFQTLEQKQRPDPCRAYQRAFIFDESLPELHPSHWSWHVWRKKMAGGVHHSQSLRAHSPTPI